MPTFSLSKGAGYSWHIVFRYAQKILKVSKKKNALRRFVERFKKILCMSLSVRMN